MIKVKLFNMHLNRDLHYTKKSYEEDKAWMQSLNGLCIPNNSMTWKDIQLTFEDDYDYSVVLDQMFKPVSYINPKKSILFRLEPDIMTRTRGNYLDESQFIKTYRFVPLWGWLGLSINQISHETDFTKTKVLSSIISSSGGLDRPKRLRLVSYLDRLPYFEFYGKDKTGRGFFNSLKSYKGELPVKLLGLQRFKYHYNAENTQQKDYFTEKILDALLSECLVFYSGAPNISQYINEKAYIPIDLDDPEKSMFIIKRSIRLNEWEQRIDIIKQEKKKVLYELNIMNLIYNAIHQIKNYWEK